MSEILENPSEALLDKYEKLKEYLRSLGSVAVAFSSGVDSTFLLFAAKDALGENMMAITSSSLSFPKREYAEAKSYCESLNVKQVICETNELEIEGFAENPKNRCYLCKRVLFSKMLETSKKENMKELVEGSNLDDNGDYRPGMQAIAELKVKSPLREVGFTKKEIRILSKHFDLPTWDKPSFACLSTRFAYGETITKEKLKMVDAAEQLLMELGFHQFRVRIHDKMARIEILPEEFEKMLSKEIREKVVSELKEMGFTYISMDLVGYRTGSMNEGLKLKK